MGIVFLFCHFLMQIAAPVETMGRAAAKLQLKKMTSIGNLIKLKD